MRKTELDAVIFDWAGTLVDFGSLAPTQIFVDAFATFNIPVTLAQAAGPMGLSKRHHIQTLLAEPTIQAAWQTEFGRASTDDDIDALYDRFMPMQIAKVGEYSQAIPGAIDALEALRARGIKIGSCSGYPKVVMAEVLAIAREQGIIPDHVVAGDELEAGARPGAYMALANMLALQCPEVRRCVKVDDTEPGVAEGRNAGMWTIGLALSGACAGLSLAQYQAATSETLDPLRAQASERLNAAGAHFVIDTIADLLPVITEIEQRLSRGERP